MSQINPLYSLLEKAYLLRKPLIDDRHQQAFRLFNGFLEGDPNLQIDIYAQTALLHNYANLPSEGASGVATANQFLLDHLPWVNSVLVKVRAGNETEKRGVHLRGEKPATKIKENGVWYALNLTMNRDASLYLDTRSLRKWAKENLSGKRVLNTFAYTGSLGVSALAGGASQVIHIDLNKEFLNVAKTSYTLNGYPIRKSDFMSQDFFTAINFLKRNKQVFDCVFLDAPFFSSTSKGRVDLQNDTTRLINKLRPLVQDGGWLVAINNALFLSGEEYWSELEGLCADGHLAIERHIPVEIDFTGSAETQRIAPPTDPAPFNHSTKIAVLQVRHSK